ncbi:hypothetical protein J3B02_001394 [Coemansia erecta]|nr:hypothetical protein J3B02_001394 [Coemansia erecta]
MTEPCASPAAKAAGPTAATPACSPAHAKNDDTHSHPHPSARHSVSVDLSNRMLADVPKDLPYDVASLSLRHNMLIRIPPSFGRAFSMLHTLDLSGNQIVVLPEEISHLQGLRELNVSRNALIGLPITIGSLRCLEILDLSENCIIALDMSMARLQSLRMLNLSDNRLASLPSYLGLLSHSLRILLVDGNPFDRSLREMVEPILTVSSRDAKRIAKAKEKSEKLREKAVKRGESPKHILSNRTPLHSLEYTMALTKLMAVRLRRSRSRKQSISTNPVTSGCTASGAPRAVARPPELNLQRAKSQSHILSSSKHSADSDMLILSPLPAPESACLPKDKLSSQMASLDIGGSSENPSAAVAASKPSPSPSPNSSSSRVAGVNWNAPIEQSAELNEYRTRQLPPLPLPDNELAPSTATAALPELVSAQARQTESKPLLESQTESQTCNGSGADSPYRAVALGIARRIANGISDTNAPAGSHGSTEPASSIRSYQNSMPSGSVANTSTITSSDMANRSSTSSSSQESHSSSMDDSTGLIQDASKVARALWQLRDDWDLDPRHSEADSVRHMLAQLRDGNVRIDGALEVDRVYREKAPTAGGCQRLKILSELLVTEVTYVDTLKNVVGVYLNPMREAKILSESELREIFSNIEVILAFHNDHFLPSITYAISQPDTAIGKAFLHHGAHFKLYSTYTNNHETSAKTLSSVMARRAVNGFIQSARGDVTQLGQVGLDGHLLTPVQRLPRYRMLLLDLLSNTPEDHPDHEALYAALKELNRTIYEVNEKKRVFENQARLRKIQEKVVGSSEIPLIAPHRVFKLMANFRLQVFSEHTVDKAGMVSVRRTGVGTVYRFFLFNDMILQCTIVMNKDLRVNRIYRLESRVIPAEVTSDNELRIVDSDGILYLKGDAADIRRWAQEINSRLEK